MDDKIFALAAKIPVMLQGIPETNKAAVMEFARDIGADFLEVCFSVTKANIRKDTDNACVSSGNLKEKNPLWLQWVENNRNASQPAVLFFSDYTSLPDNLQQLAYEPINERKLQGISFDYCLKNGQPGLYIFIAKPYTRDELIEMVKPLPLQVANSISMSAPTQILPMPDKLFRFVTPFEMSPGRDFIKKNLQLREIVTQLIPEWKGENRYRFYLLFDIDDDEIRRYMSRLVERYLFLNSIIKSRTISDCNVFPYACDYPGLIYDPPIRFDNERSAINFKNLLSYINESNSKKEFLEEIAIRYSPDRIYSPAYKKWEPPIAITEADLKIIAEEYRLEWNPIFS